MLDLYIVLLLIAVPLLLVATRWRDEVAPLIDRLFERFDLPQRRRDFDPDAR
ncbi:hypothetical protein [Sphingomicrobium nitratireducens]|uniref:hypothetical protein n=1 Tax=Sphingomicrobium nitratireducens TaxID=2964666 RepID=UPI00223EDC40|nr:hypothetical protein [Sphingomicrobium nitratireducens]